MEKAVLFSTLFCLTLSTPALSASYEELRDCYKYRYIMFSDLGEETVKFDYNKGEKKSCVNKITDIYSKKFDIPFRYINNETIFSIRQCIIPMLLMRIDSIDINESSGKYQITTMVKVIIFETPQCQRSKKEISLRVHGKFKTTKSKALTNNLLTASITISNWLKGKDYL